MYAWRAKVAQNVLAIVEILRRLRCRCKRTLRRVGVVGSQVGPVAALRTSINASIGKIQPLELALTLYHDRENALHFPIGNQFRLATIKRGMRSVVMCRVPSSSVPNGHRSPGFRAPGYRALRALQQYRFLRRFLATMESRPAPNILRAVKWGRRALYLGHLKAVRLFAKMTLLGERPKTLQEPTRSPRKAIRTGDPAWVNS